MRVSCIKAVFDLPEVKTNIFQLCLGDSRQVSIQVFFFAKKEIVQRGAVADFFIDRVGSAAQSQYYPGGRTLGVIKNEPVERVLNIRIYVFFTTPGQRSAIHHGRVAYYGELVVFAVSPVGENDTART